MAILWNGEPGETHTNETNRVEYQLIVSWTNSCGTCIQYDHAVSNSWPIPLHRNCRCKQWAIYPSQTSEPFVDFRQKIAELPPEERVKVVGKSNLQLINEGVVTWSDVVRKGRIRDLNQVVAVKKLSIDQLIAAGVKKSIAETAFASVHTPGHVLAAEKRKALTDAILAKGVSREQLKQYVADRLAGRLAVTGPAGPLPGPKPVVPPKPTPTPTPKPKPVPRPKPKPKPKPAVPGLPLPVPARVRQRVDYLRKARVKPEEALVQARREQVVAKLAELDAALDAGAVALAEARAESLAKSAIAKASWSQADFDAARVARERWFTLAAERDALAARKLRLAPWEAEVRTNPKLIPAWDVTDRIEEYRAAGGGAKLEALLLAGSERKAAVASRDAEILAIAAESGRLLKAVFAAPAGGAERAALEAEKAVLLKRFLALKAENPARKTAARVAEILAPASPIVLAQAPADSAVMPKAAPLDPRLQPAVDAGLDWIRGRVEAAGLPPQSLAIGSLDDPAKDRSHAGEHGIVLDPKAAPWVVVHEFGHVLDGRSGAGKAAVDFLAHRVGDEVPQALATVFPGHGYRPDEMGRKDKFEDAFGLDGAYYVGKVGGSDRSSEITAMGLQKLYEDASGFAERDPEFCLFILGILDGSLR